MKIIKKSLLVASISTVLAGCGDESFKPEVKTSNEAPVVSSNINIALHEKDEVSFAHLLGTATGAKTGADVVKDADGDFLSVKNLTADLADATGFELEGNTLLLRPAALMDSLDTGQTHTIVFTYDVSDGETSTPRTATFTVAGEDFEPEITGDLVGNFTKDAVTGTLNLLTNVTDADNEPLTASNLVANSNNALVIPASINDDNELVLDIASIASQVPDGQKITLEYTYEVSDHRFDKMGNLTINVLGVKDIPGAPLIGNYFLSDELNETSPLKTYDLIDDVVDREDDAISVKNLKLNGVEALKYGISLDQTNLNFSPNAFLTDIASDASMVFEFTYQIEDSNGNTSDGERSLIVTVNGVESNILKAQGASVTFEDENLGATPAQWYAFGWEGAGGPVVSTDAHSGTNGATLAAGGGMAINWDSAADRVYYYAGWSRTDAPNTSANFPAHFNVYGNGSGRAWWDGGNRQWVADMTVWAETAVTFNTFESGFAIHPDASFQIFNGPAASHSGVNVFVDDIRIVDITDIDGYANNMLTVGGGSFEDGVIPANNGVGLVSVTDTATEVTQGSNALVVDTTGNATASEVVLPVQAGAIKTGGRYMLALDIQAINAVVDTKTAFQVKLETASGEIFNFYPTISSNTPNFAVRVMLNTDSATGTPDWENEDASIRLIFTVAGITYHVDNVTLFAVP